MASSIAAPGVGPKPAARPVAESAPATEPAQPTAAPAVRDQWFRNLQIGLFTVGALLMPAGLFAIFLGWYGTAHTKYQYDQLPYVVSGGLLGLGLVILGGFLYFGAWLAKLGNEQRESTQKLADTMRLVADALAAQNGAGAAARSATVDGAADASLVLAGAGSTVHRRDCPLITHREDLRPVSGRESGLGTCRVCRPVLD